MIVSNNMMRMVDVLMLNGIMDTKYGINIIMKAILFIKETQMVKKCGFMIMVK